MKLSEKKVDTDEDYSDGSDGVETSSSNGSEITVADCFPCLLEDLSESDIYNIIIDIYEQIGEFHRHHILTMSSPQFYKNMIEHIANVLQDEWLNADLYGDISDEEEVEFYEELTDFVEQIWEVYTDFAEYPLRSISYEHLRHEQINVDVRDITRKIRHLQSLPQPAQRSKEWYEFRNNLISASSLSKVFGSEAQVNSLIYEKCCPMDPNAVDFSRTNLESAAHWGVKYEPVTVMIYEDMFHTEVGEFGCIQHAKYPFIGASPDGINVDTNSARYGRMLEIKNIYNRDITGVPKEEYWVQTQVQMEVCDLDYCDFMETRIKEYGNEAAFYADLTNGQRDYKGVVLHFIETDTRSSTVNQPRYQYMPLNIEKSRSAIQEWIQNMRNECKPKGLVLFHTLYWYLDEYSCVLIPRNRAWFEAALPKIKAVWNTIIKERVEGYEHRAAKKRVLKNTIVTSDMSGNTYQIENLNLNKSVCLVKLD
jgi:putative phage-type endonuclease